MKIAICDDNVQCRESITALIKEYFAAHPGLRLSVSVFEHGEDLLEAASIDGGFDVCFLDIIMPDINGIELGRQLRSAGHRCKIIYLSSSPEYAVDAFRVKAFDYLLKPISREALFPLLDELTANVKEQEKSIIAKTREGSIRITYDTICYTTLNKRAIRYRLIDGTAVDTTSIRVAFSEAMQTLLQDRRFVQCGAGHVVNLHQIASIGDGALQFRNGEKLYPGVKAMREVRSLWYDYWFEKENQA